jgi:hypothetical protein
MSQENVEIARRLSEAFNRAYADGTPDLYELLDPDIEWVPIKAISKEPPTAATRGCGNGSRN